MIHSRRVGRVLAAPNQVLLLNAAEAFRQRSVILFRALAPAAEGVAAEPALTR
jgi:hypothetical protein